ncbi:MAG: bifunctional UDP-N-acetylglucosamine diphosphorylase/glucosamine-1-phosphate N-acetyltransferase GlmU [Pseudomonadota bacterium]
MTKALAILLAAGEGTRMRSARPKVLQEVGNRPLIAHVSNAAAQADVDTLAIVIGPRMEAVSAAAEQAAEGTRQSVSCHVQSERLGTGHAVLAARAAISDAYDHILVLLGDAPLVRPQTIMAAREALSQGADIAVVGFRAADPTGYGRLIVEDDQVIAIREHRDATPTERAIDFCNSGIMAFAQAPMLSLLDAIGNDNSKGEYYLTDAVEIANRAGLVVRAVEAPETEVMGVNDRAQLAECEAAFQVSKRAAILESGVSLIAPETVFFSADTRIGPDATIEPHVVFGPGTVVEGGARIRAFSHLEGAHVAADAEVGPYARLRPGTEIGEGARIGNFVEAKNAVFGPGAKANHLSYVGDSSVGAKANIGAGTITCNYDGFFKYRTEIGEGAFIGSNSALVAPVRIGAGAIVGSGSVITDSVPDDAMALGRGRQVIKENRAAQFRETKSNQKKQS